MWFKLSFSLSDMHLNSISKLPLDIQINSDIKLVFWMREVMHQGQMTRTLCCDAVAERAPSAAVLQSLEGLLCGQLVLDNPPQEDLPYATDDTVIVDGAGKITPNWHVPLSLMAKNYQPFQRNLLAELSDIIRDFVRNWRWRANAASSHSPFAYLNFSYSLDGTAWRILPYDYGIAAGYVRKGLPTEAEVLSSVAEMVRAGSTEPFPHELAREGHDLAWSKPRSALLIAMAALETGIKQYIVHLSPQTAPLIEKLPAPPVATLLQEIIPQMHDMEGIKTNYLPLDKSASEYLRKWVTQRNQVAHGVKNEVDKFKLIEFIRFVVDILYAFDVLRGNSWAAANIVTGRLAGTQR